MTLEPTPHTTRGPEYRRGAPWRSDLREPGHPGVPLIVRGQVRGTGGEPVPDALLEFWQTDARGLYSDFFGLRRDPAKLWMRCRMKAAGDGSYELRTIIPGRYPLWPLTRPRHIHVSAAAPGYRFLATQIFFRHEWLNRFDPMVKRPLIVTLTEEHGERVATFDLVLERERGGGGA